VQNGKILYSLSRKNLILKWNRSGHDIAHPARPVDAPGDNKFNAKDKQKQKGTMQ